jgi:type VI secretion system protein ImpB
MANESQQHKLDRVRRPRVQITYDVETNGAMQKVELPFVVGIMADLSGQPKEPLKALKDRKFVQIDRDNFDEVLAKSAPRLAMRVNNKLTDENTQLNAELNFQSLDDFSPARVAEQIPALKELLEKRQKLSQLLSKMEGNDKLEALLGQLIGDADKAKGLAQELGLGATDTTEKKPEGA